MTKLKKDLVIESAQNAVFKTLKDLSSSSGIKKHGQFFLMGEKLIQEFLKNPKDYGNFEVLSEVIPSNKSSQSKDIQKIILAPKLFEELDVIGTHSNLLLLQAADIPSADLQKKPHGLQLISPLGDPSNLGALTRSALAFGVKNILLTQDSCHPFHPKVVKSSSGACLKMNYSRVESLQKMEASTVSSLFLLDQNGQSLKNFKWPKDLFLMIGEEGPGFQRLNEYQKLTASQKISIPTEGVESLNATVAASCALFHWKMNS